MENSIEKCHPEKPRKLDKKKLKSNTPTLIYSKPIPLSMSLSRFFIPKQLAVSPQEMQLFEMLEQMQKILKDEYAFWSRTKSKTTVGSISRANTFLAGLMNAFFQETNQFLHFLACFERAQFRNLVCCFRVRKGSSVQEKVIINAIFFIVKII